MSSSEKTAAGPITVETICGWKMRERAHYNGGKGWFGYGYQCIENPRLYRIDRYKRATRSVEIEWQVDGEKVASLEVGAELLNAAPSLDGEESAMLELIPVEFAPRSEIKEREEHAQFADPFHLLHFLDRKGMIEWEDGRVRLTIAGRLAKLAREECCASGTPEFEAVSRRVNAERAALLATGAKS